MRGTVIDMSLWSRVVATGLTVAALALITGPAALAHDQLVSTDPADGAVLDAPPDHIGLRFSDDVLDISTTLLVTGPTGEVPVTANVAGRDVTAELPAGLTSGAYQVTWRVVSSDGHPVQGSFAFTINGTTQSASPTPTTAPSTDSFASTDTNTSEPITSATPTESQQLPVGAAILVAVALVVAGAVLWRARTQRRTR